MGQIVSDSHVELIIRKLSEGATEADLLDAYPRLIQADIKAALAFAADSFGIVSGMHSRNKRKVGAFRETPLLCFSFAPPEGGEAV
jgi:hypothetical protein